VFFVPFVIFVLKSGRPAQSAWCFNTKTASLLVIAGLDPAIQRKIDRVPY